MFPIFRYIADYPLDQKSAGSFGSFSASPGRRKKNSASPGRPKKISANWDFSARWTNVPRHTSPRHLVVKRKAREYCENTAKMKLQGNQSLYSLSVTQRETAFFPNLSVKRPFSEKLSVKQHFRLTLSFFRGPVSPPC